MTKEELTNVIGYTNPRLVEMAIQRSLELYPDKISRKKKNNFLIQDFTRDEIKHICLSFDPPFNELQINLVLDNFTHRGKKYINKISPYIKGTERFLQKYEKDRKCKACCCCSYLIGKSFRTGSGKLYPFCNFYNRFVYSMKIEKAGKEKKVNIFVDYCSMFEKNTPKLFLKR